MKLYYYKDQSGNFGDDLNPWIWDRLLPGFFDDEEDAIFVGIGTLLTSRLNNRFPTAKRHVVFGSGAGYKSLPENCGKWDYICVRGPKTARALDLPPHAAVVDPAVFIGRLFPRSGAIVHRAAFMPHHVSAANADWRAICERASIHYIDPCLPVEDVMQDIAASALLLAEAMHGAIAAEAFRVPWVPVRCYPHILDFKWQDWAESLGMHYQPFEMPRVHTRGAFRNLGLAGQIKTIAKHGLSMLGLPDSKWEEPVSILRYEKQMDRAAKHLAWLACHAQPMLAKDTVFEEKLSLLSSRLDLLKAKYTS